MDKNLVERVVQLKTDRGLVFSAVCDNSGIGKIWEYFYDGDIKRVIGAYVSGAVAEPIRLLYTHFRDGTSEEDRKDIHYGHKLQRLVNIAGDENFRGQNGGYAWILVNKDGQYDMRLLRITQAEVITRKKVTSDLPKAEPVSSENGHASDYPDTLPWPAQSTQETGLVDAVQGAVGPPKHDPMRVAGLSRSVGKK